MKNEALEFIRRYAEEHFTYTGDQVLEAYREAGGAEYEDAGRASRLNWGNMMLRAEKAGIHKTIGRVKPRSKHSHIASTCLRQSLVFKGEAPDEQTPHQYLNFLWQECAERNMTWKEALRLAYQYGVESS